MGLMPDRPVAAMRDVIESVKRLLAGETVDLKSEALTLDGITITHPSAEQVPMTMGVMSPMMLRLAGQIADATLFGASAGVEYFERAIAHVRTGLDRAGRAADAMSYRTIALASVDRDGDRARRILRPVMAEFLAEFADMSTVSFYGISDELGQMVKRGGAEVVAAEMPDQWLDDLALVGTPREVADKVLRWVAAGIDAIAIFLPHESERDTLTVVAEEVVPLVAESREWRT
jgi:alkanesulfonate monooxygenase SsuD/methylene tetrahydromethanopterin reductase-like flavin-dependent oxidoreductase (luciferase family)